MSGHLPVAEVAEALGTSPQTVRTLLRKGDLRGEKVAWGSRYVWGVTQEALDEFIAEHGRLDGRRRTRRRAAAPMSAEPSLPSDEAEQTPRIRPDAEATPRTTSITLMEPHGARPYRRPFALRPRGRATAVVVLLGIPLLITYLAARLTPGALWFEEVGHRDVFTRLVAGRADFYTRVLVVVAVVVALNLIIALRPWSGSRPRARWAFALVASVVIGTLFGSAFDGHWETYALWRHREPFGTTDPVHGKDVGFYVFSLPLYIVVTQILMWVLAFTAVVVAAAYAFRGRLRLRPLRASFAAQIHLSIVAATFLCVIAWRLQLQQYQLLLEQPSGQADHSFAGAGYVDLHVRSPTLTALTVLVLVLATVCVAFPFLAGTRFARPAHITIGVTSALMALGLGVVGGFGPALVQRYLVDPNPLLSERSYLERTIAATREGLALDQVEVTPYDPAERFTAADFPGAEQRLGRVPAWDTYILSARMRELVSEPPFYRPGTPALDVMEKDGKVQLTTVSAREIDVSKVAHEGGSWSNDRLSFTHGFGLVRFSSTEVAPNRQPRLLDYGRGVDQPRIYFGDLPPEPGRTDIVSNESRLLAPVLDERMAESPWVLANTRRPEVDVLGPDDSTEPYHYDGTGGIAMSDWFRRTVFALTLESKELLLSDDITPESRLLLHRDVHDRLETLAPFITWDSQAAPLTTGGRITYVVNGYTTSANYPYAERVDLGGSQVNYARASVIATVDAFDGDVELYVTDEDDPIIGAWEAIVPGLFESSDQIPDELQGRLRYPSDLFAAQATAYERFHTTEPDVFVSNADLWSRPLALSGPIEVAGDVDFDEDDEDDLRLTLPPVYIYAPPPGETDSSLLLATYYSPDRGQSLVAALNGWIDEEGRPRLASRTLAREPITLGPAQVSRMVFATPRVRNLLGLRNLEIRDLDKSSIDSILLGRPRIVLLAGGVVQIQNLYEGSRGAGAARLLGVTAFVNGRAGLGPNAKAAVRQALNEPPRIDVMPPAGPVNVREPAVLGFHVDNARREIITITEPNGTTRLVRKLAGGVGTIRWVPASTGISTVEVRVVGLDGTSVTGRTRVRVLATPPTVRLLDKPRRAVAGEPVRVRFRVAHAVDEVVTVSTRSGIVFERRFDIDEGEGLVSWVPARAGTATLKIRVTGRHGQQAMRVVRFEVGRRQSPVPPTATISEAPTNVRVGDPVSLTFRAQSCAFATALIRDASGVVQRWRMPCPADPGRVQWTPTRAGTYTFAVTASNDGTSSESRIVFQVRDSP